MVLVYSLPIFLSYGLVYQKGVVYYAILGIHLLPFCMIASSLSVLVSSWRRVSAGRPYSKHLSVAGVSGVSRPDHFLPNDETERFANPNRSLPSCSIFSR